MKEIIGKIKGTGVIEVDKEDEGKNYKLFILDKGEEFDGDSYIEDEDGEETIIVPLSEDER